MNVNALLEEYGLSTDDVRWSLCCRLTESLMHLAETKGAEGLCQNLWSGALGDELYDMEERWHRDRDDRLSRAVLDEGHLRDELSQMTLDKIKRSER
ncbi:MAG: hypothetical protein MI717_00055 [Spirochaetales bacterium]|nr:hypothetical protein [Spirochaetales bacterium]